MGCGGLITKSKTLRIRIELCNYGHGHQYNCLAHHMFMSIISIPHDLKWFSSETSTQIKLIRSRNSLVFHTFPQTYVNLQFGFSWAKIHSRIIGVCWIMGVLLHVSCSKLPQKWWLDTPLQIICESFGFPQIHFHFYYECLDIVRIVEKKILNVECWHIEIYKLG